MVSCWQQMRMHYSHQIIFHFQRHSVLCLSADRVVFLDKREFTGPVYNQIEEAVDFVLRNIRLGATIGGLVRKENMNFHLKLSGK